MPDLSSSEQAEAGHILRQGFLRAYDSVRSRVMSITSEILRGDGKDWRVYVTGHSLGGALATLCSYEIANRRYAFFYYYYYRLFLPT